MEADELTRLGERRQDLMQQLDEVHEQLQEAVRAGFAKGMTAPQMAQVIGVTKARIYQMRDGRR